MSNTKVYTAIGGFLGILILILDSKTAIAGATQGIELCIKVVVPALFPFFVLSALLTSALAGSKKSMLRPLATLLGIPDGAESVFITGVLGGYPLGAKSVSDICHSGQLPQKDAQRMMAFCNHAGPSFIFGMTSVLFISLWIPWALWGIQIISSVMTAIILPGRSEGGVQIRPGKPAGLPDALHTSLKATASICGWVVLFRILIAIMQRWILWILPNEGQVLIMGLLELTNGFCDLDSVSNEGTRMILASAFLAFGGICVTMQTLSLASFVSMKLYLPGKILQAFASVVLTCLVLWGIPGVDKPNNLADIGLTFFCLWIISAAILRKTQKRSSNPAPVGV